MSNDARARISLDAAPFEAGARLAIKASEAMAGAMKTAMGTAIGVIGGSLVMGAIGKLANGIQSLTTGGISLAASMADLAAETGMAADEATKYNFALKNGLSNKAAEQLMGAAARNIGSVADVFRNIQIRMESIWLNLQGVFAKIASFFAPVIDQILDMVEQVDWDSWVKSAQEFITPLRNGIMSVIQLATEGKLWAFAGEVMSLGFMKAKNILDYTWTIAKEAMPAIGSLLTAALKGAGNAIIYIGNLINNVLGAAFNDSGKLFGESLYFGLATIGGKLLGFLVKIFTAPIAVLLAGLMKGFAELMESLPDWAKPEGMKDYVAPSFEDLLGENLKVVDGISAAFDKIGNDAAAELANTGKELGSKLTAAAKATKFEDMLGAGSEMETAIKGFQKALGTQFVDKNGSVVKQDEITAILKSAFTRIKDREGADTKSIKRIKPLFGEVDSLSSVGGGGGVGTGLMGVLDESKRQTRLQERMVELLSPTTSTAPGSRSGNFSVGF